MFTAGIKVIKTEDELIIKWQLSEVKIPLKDIIEVIEDETYGGQSPDSIRIGTPYGTTDRIIVRTKQHNYLLFTTNKFTILKEINS